MKILKGEATKFIIKGEPSLLGDSGVILGWQIMCQSRKEENISTQRA